MMQVEERPSVTYADVGGCKEQIEKLREVVELPLLEVSYRPAEYMLRADWQPERFANLGIEPPKGVLLYGPPGTGKTLCARAVANRTDSTFIRGASLSNGLEISADKSHRIRACAEVHWRGSTNGPRVVRDGSIKESLYHLL